MTAELFKPMSLDRKAYIEEVYSGSQLASKIGETQNVPVATPKVANKLTTYVADFANSVNFLRQILVRVLSKFCKFGGTPMFWAIPSQA